MTADRAEPQQPSLFHRMGEALQYLVGCADCATDPWTRRQNGGQDALAALHEYEEFVASPAPDPAQEAAPVAQLSITASSIDLCPLKPHSDAELRARFGIGAHDLYASPPAAPVANGTEWQDAKS